ncbi:MAG TPA: AAA family ATPase, partial [Gammaproteobacteria bacterium]|nr:AAA family ATPase [Gammaproteobacteria bacterium]
MNDRRDLDLVLRSSVPIILVETADERRFLELLRDVCDHQPKAEYRPQFRWSVTDGLQRLDLTLEKETENAAPSEVLETIRQRQKPGVFALLDFHPYLSDPVNVRLLKDIAIDARRTDTTVVLISHAVEIPPELRTYSARFEVSLPGAAERHQIIDRLLEEYREDHPGSRMPVDSHALELLVQNLGGLSHSDVERLARNAVFDDGAITADDVPAVMQAKYELLNQRGILSYEYETVGFDAIAGFSNVKVWLQQRRDAFGDAAPAGLDPPKGLLLLGVQGCGKSLAAKATASAFGLPLLRLEFGALFNKYHGETERNLRESLKMAEIMSPCVLWLDEIEKGLGGSNDDTGTSRRVLASLLTWMAERSAPIMLVATANDIAALPAELIRKGRFDEIFFVDLPGPRIRGQILEIHMRDRGLDPAHMDLPRLAHHTEGFSGAEIEQGIVAALYAAHAQRREPEARHLLAEFRKTRPLSVIMAERIDGIRAWAAERTVPADAEPRL